MGRKSKDELAKERAVKVADRWRKENTTKFTIVYNSRKFDDVIKKLLSVPAKNQYIAKLIREDLRREEEKKKKHQN